MRIWRATYADPNKGNPLKELYEIVVKLVTEEVLLCDIKNGLIVSAKCLGEVTTK